MPATGKQMLTVAAILVAFVSLFHVVCAVVGPPAFRYFGGEAMAKSASASPRLTILCLLLAVVFALCAVYALSAAGRFRPLPLLRAAIIVTGIIFALRGLFLVSEII